MPFEIKERYYDEQGRMVMLYGLLLGVQVVLANVYAPNHDDPGFVETLFQVIGKWDNAMWIIGGDFNCILHPTLDRSSRVKRPLNKSAQRTLQYMDVYDVVDTWRVRYQDDPGYSYYSHVHKMYSRIDRIMVSTSLYCRIQDMKLEARTLSDHNPIWLALNWAPKYHRLTNWTFRPLLLTDVVFEAKLRVHIQQFFDENSINDTGCGMRWEAFKCVMRGAIASDESGMRKVLRNAVETIEMTLAAAEGKHREAPSDEALANLVDLRLQYKTKTDEEQKMLAKPRNARYYWQADKPSSLLAGLLKGERSARTISTVADVSGKYISDPHKIVAIMEEHLRSIYKGNNTCSANEMSDYLDEIPLLTLDGQQAASLDREVDVQEIFLAIKELKRGKAPGQDGIGNEFYKHYTHILGPILLEVYTEAFDSGKLHGRMNEAKLTLLPKSGGNAKNCADYRPLSLINSDVKILAKILANRILPYLPMLISTDQNGFVPGRDTAAAIRRVHCIIAGLPTDSEAAMVSLDAYKAFDMINWNFLFTTMAKMGIGANFIRWVRVLYTDPKARLVLNETWSEVIEIHSGTRQGCPLSAILFAISMEPLLRVLNDKMGHAGIEIIGIRNLTIAYADDLLLCLNDPFTHLQGITRLIENYGKYSGFKINWKKSIYFPIGSGAHPTSPDSRLQSRNDGFKYLGVQITGNESMSYKLNYAETLKVIKSKLEGWDKLPLNIAARITVVKMSVLPKILYYFHNVPIQIPKPFFKDLRSMVTRFIWNNKIPRVAYDKLTRPYEEGGFELPNFYLYYKAAQLTHVVRWLEAESLEPQVMMERGWFGVHEAHRLLMDDRVKERSITGPAKLGLKIWRETNRRMASGHNYSPYLSIWDTSIQNPKLTEKLYASWVEHGILMMQDIYAGGTLKEDKDLVDEAGGGLLNIMKWQTLKACIKKRWPIFQTEPIENELLTHVITSVGERHQISKLYKILRNGMRAETDKLQLKWERTLDVPIEDRVWKNACGLTRNIAFNMKLRLVHYRFLTQSYYTPARLNAIYKSNEICCNKCEETEADFLHMTWNCPKLMEFWDEVMGLVSDISEYTVLNETKCIFLYDLPMMDMVSLRWVRLSIAVAKLMIARKWTSKNAPVIEEWKAYMGYCAAQEQELQCIMPNRQTPKDIWGDFRKYLQRGVTDSEDDDNEHLSTDDQDLLNELNRMEGRMGVESEVNEECEE